MKPCIAILAFMVAMSSHTSLFAHGGHSHANERTWTFPNGRTHLHGCFVASKDGQVQIRRSDDSLVSLKLSELNTQDQKWVAERTEQIRKANDELMLLTPSSGLLFVNHLPYLMLTQAVLMEQSQAAQPSTPKIASAFDAFVQNKAIKTRWDKDFFYVESNGLPDHQMMVGITAWQQQVPLPQAYVGNNAWQIPLRPVPAKTPVSANGKFLRGAIALAVNGIPIFNPLNNRGDDAFLFGELDEFGGHCGRADDYHYHIAPMHLEKINGKGLPVAYALDGYPIYGFEEADGSEVKNLDKLNGHKDADGQYHYHASKTYPYLNGGFYGVVTERDGQVDPQPRAQPMRPALTPMRGAKITNFKETKPGSYQLTYDVQGKSGSVSYTINANGSADFVFVGTNGKTTTESYKANQRGGQDRPPRGNDRQPPPRNDPPPRKDENPPKNNEQSSIPSVSTKLLVSSSAFANGGNFPAEFTCDGAKISPPVEWKDAPKGTKSFALSLWHTAPDQEKSYWVVYNIPADAPGLAKNSKDFGKMGLNDKRRNEYDPMCSKGPGAKEYHITVYALSDEVKLAPDQATRAKLLAAIQRITLAEGTLNYKYERKK